MIYYEVYINGLRAHKCTNRDEAHQYIEKNHNAIMPFLEYEPTGAGSLETWTNGLMDIEVVRVKKGKTNVEELLASHTEREEKERAPVREVNVDKATPLTPKRTRFKDSKKPERAEEGKMKMDREGNMWVSKKNRKGEYKWTRFYEENYENGSQRKSPKMPAREFEEGAVKKGMDGKMWKVKLLANGNKRWIRKNNFSYT